MDTYLLKAAVLYAISATSHTATLLDDISQNGSSPSADLDPLTYELFDMRAPLERLGDSELVIPRQLQQPILTIVRGCGDALVRIDDWVDRFSCESPRSELLPKISELNGSLRTCRRTLQLALEAVNLSQVDDDGMPMESLPTYLDQDTSRVLALIRRTLQQTQEGEQQDELHQLLRSALDEIRLYIQSKCKGRDETKIPLIQDVGLQPTIPGEASQGERAPPKMPLQSNAARPSTPTRDSHGSGSKLASVIARLSLGSPRKSNLSSLSSIRGSVSRPSSSLSSSQLPEDDRESVASSAAQTSRKTSRVSELSRSSLSSGLSSRGSRITPSPSLTPHSLSPTPPKRNPRRLTLPSMDEGVGTFTCMPSPPTPGDAYPASPAAFDQVSISESVATQLSRKGATEGTSRLPLFAISPSDKIVIDPADMPKHGSPHRTAGRKIDLVRTKLLASKEKGEGHGSTVYFVDLSPASYILASKQGDKSVKIYGLPQCNIQASLKINFYIQMRERSRDFFVTSHAILSETRSLVAITTGFGQTLEIWNWALKKKLQVIESVYRWAGAKTDIYETSFGPLACYREDRDSICLFPIAADGRGHTGGTTASKKKPFGDPITIDLQKAGLPHIPKLPELVYSSTAPLLVAAAGPRPPRTGHPPPEHAAMLMVWELHSSPSAQSLRPWRFAMPAQYPELETALPCGLATYGNVVVSLWIPHHVRVIGRPGAWQVEPVEVPERFVLVWNFEAGTTLLFPIPNENTIACISPDCRFVAYRQGPGADTRLGREVGLVVLDAATGAELWRTPTLDGGTGLPRDCDQLMDLSRVTSISFSSDGGQIAIGDAGGSVGIYEVKSGGQAPFNIRSH